MDGFNLGILIPAFNEEKTVAEIILKARKFGSVILSDDSSLDNTIKLSKKAGAIVLTNIFDKGYEGNLKTLLKFASEKGQFSHYITLDADGELPPDQISKFLENMQSYDLCIGQRSKFNRTVEYFLGIYFYFRYGIRDPISGMKFYSKSLLCDFYNDKRELNLGTSIIKFCKSRQYKIDTIKIKVKKRKDSSRFGESIFSQLKLIRIIFRDLK